MKTSQNIVFPVLFGVVFIYGVTVPYHFRIGGPVLSVFAPNLATAESGSGKNGNGGGGGNSGSGSGNSGSGSGNSGSGSGNSGSGSGNSGSGGGHSGSGSGNSGSGGGNNGSGSGNSGSGSGNSGSDSSPTTFSAIISIELSASGVEIRYADGSRDVIKDQKYTHWNANGKAVVARRATGADIARLRARANGVSIASVRRPTGAGATRIKTTSTTNGRLAVTYSNGWSEEITNRTYELKDQYGRTVVRRPATKSDTRRLGQVPGN